MRSWFHHPVRVTSRLIWLGAELLLGAGDYVLRCSFQSPENISAARAAWLQRLSLRALKVFGVDMCASGRIPACGLLVCNHLGYLDIPVIAALAPCVFVAKSEVRHWPVFGWFARLAGTVFIHRAKRSDVGRVASEIQAALAAGRLVVLFPEGTSSGGETVLPFKSALLETVTPPGPAVTAAHIGYQLADGDVSEEVCYWKDMTLVPHLINLLSKRSICAQVRFTELQAGHADRKELARQLRTEIMRLKAAEAY